MRAEADAGTTRVSVLGLARRLGMSNATFWRNYLEIAIEIRQAPDTPGKPTRAPQPGNEAKLAGQNASLRRERDALAGQLEAALAHLRRLTTDNSSPGGSHRVGSRQRVAHRALVRPAAAGPAPVGPSRAGRLIR
jgi:transposase-like protein